MFKNKSLIKILTISNKIMRILNGALCNTHRAHAAQIKLIHIDLKKGEQSYIGILLAELANSWQFFRLFTVIQKLFEFF